MVENFHYPLTQKIEINVDQEQVKKINYISAKRFITVTELIERIVRDGLFEQYELEIKNA